MRSWISKGLTLEKEYSRRRLENYFKDQPYKLELIEELKDGDITIYRSGNFVDLCRAAYPIHPRNSLRCFSWIRSREPTGGGRKKPDAAKIYGLLLIRRKNWKIILLTRKRSKNATPQDR